MKPRTESDNAHFYYWDDRNFSDKEIISYLNEKNIVMEEQLRLIEEYRYYRSHKRVMRGWLLIGIGGLLGLISCVITLTAQNAPSRRMLMFLLTSTAILIAFIGCILLLEKEKRN
jgi:hypothetical protein